LLDMMETNTRSFSSRELAHLIPTIYLLASSDSIVYIISPWINVNLELNLPKDYFRNKFSGRRIKLIDLIKIIRKDKNIDTVFYIKSEAENEQSIKILKENGFTVHIIENLHDKAIISDKLIYRGSANITESGIYKNIEGCRLEKCETSPEECLREIIGEYV